MTWRFSQRFTSPRAAEEAFAAIDGGIEGDAVADLQILHFGAEFGDFARGFMTHDERRIAAAGGAVKAMHIAAADAAGADANQNFVGADFRLRHFDHFELFVLG